MGRERPTAGLSSPERRLRWLLAAGVALAGALVFLTAPGALGYRCPFFSLTGHSCFSCGLSRSLHAAIHGNIIDALHYHLMGPVLLAAAAASGLIWALEAWTGARIRLGRGTARMALAGLAGLWLIFGTVRLTIELLAR